MRFLRDVGGIGGRDPELLFKFTPMTLLKTVKS